MMRMSVSTLVLLLVGWFIYGLGVGLLVGSSAHLAFGICTLTAVILWLFAVLDAVVRR